MLRQDNHLNHQMKKQNKRWTWREIYVHHKIYTDNWYIHLLQPDHWNASCRLCQGAKAKNLFLKVGTPLISFNYSIKPNQDAKSTKEIKYYLFLPLYEFNNLSMYKMLRWIVSCNHSIFWIFITPYNMHSSLGRERKHIYVPLQKASKL